MTRVRWLVVTVVLIISRVTVALAGEPVPTFRKGTIIWSVEGGAGSQDNLSPHTTETDLDLWYAGLRVGLLPIEPLSAGAFRGALELGLEAFFQRYTGPVDASFQGLGIVGRMHVLGLGRVVPYAEFIGAAGGTDLKVREIDSDFTFLVAGGVGAAVLLTARTAVYVGYRLVHMSNGNIDTPNRGLEAHTGLLGVSFFLE